MSEAAKNFAAFDVILAFESRTHQVGCRRDRQRKHKMSQLHCLIMVMMVGFAMIVIESSASEDSLECDNPGSCGNSDPTTTCSQASTDDVASCNDQFASTTAQSAEIIEINNLPDPNTADSISVSADGDEGQDPANNRITNDAHIVQTNFDFDSLMPPNIPSSFLIDPAHLLSEATANSLNEVSREIKANASIAIVYLVVPHLPPSTHRVEDLGKRVLQQWKGAYGPKADGILIVCACVSPGLKVDFAITAKAKKLINEFRVWIFELLCFEKGGDAYPREI
jgi:hypothetical protein